MIIDALEFARASRSLEGQRPVRQFTRLCQGLPQPQEAVLHWRITGRHRGATGEAWLDVWAQGVVTLSCQRCLDPLQHTLRVSNTLGLVADPSQLEALDALEACGEGTEYETILVAEPMDVLALVEDELILALPYVPRHDRCELRSAVAAQGDSDEASPFAVLKQLREH